MLKRKLDAGLIGFSRFGKKYFKNLKKLKLIIICLLIQFFQYKNTLKTELLTKLHIKLNLLNNYV